MHKIRIPLPGAGDDPLILAGLKEIRTALRLRLDGPWLWPSQASTLKPGPVVVTEPALMPAAAGDDERRDGLGKHQLP